MAVVECGCGCGATWFIDPENRPHGRPRRFLNAKHRDDFWHAEAKALRREWREAMQAAGEAR